MQQLCLPADGLQQFGVAQGRGSAAGTGQLGFMHNHLNTMANEREQEVPTGRYRPESGEGYGISRSLPVVRRDSRSECACPASASG
jgi:hypothetical protein